MGGGGGGGGVGSEGGGGGGGQGGCERRSKVFVKIQKKKLRGGGGVGRGGGGVGGVRSGVGFGEVRGSKVWVRWVMLGMGDVNQE